MRATVALRNAARTPLIRFVGRRSVPKSIDHTPRAHPASPSGILPDSFAAYRIKAQQHGPLGRASFSQDSVGRSAGASLGPVQPAQGEFFDRADLPARFHRLKWTEAEMEAIETGGASLFA
ncbi:alpha-ketoglutarate dehydrogenase subunit KGD4 [Aspergillus clavatus NRRL 1]|uniref:37S ribosomal protein YMR-31, mitochondrial n=1 Tax=Aspergillus clavatus (strain ATCC 1007 / CBS 513.65 / DSM 816 / NCTC 3887 / NRRL 1 / QM 1276 / 107) TaxID=344612 RepID=A1CE74_ASPCL|nr:uncharacterized protein ACLA_088620 [Aspergillus clavatus NRRL 1]EAW11173.1 conserved hypothetical protein [Aspergillus clavatus NRRL 1]